MQPGKTIVLTGAVGKYKGLCLKNPEYELLSGDDDDQLHTGRIVPLYRLTEKVSQRVLRKWIASALERVERTPKSRQPWPWSWSRSLTSSIGLVTTLCASPATVPQHRLLGPFGSP